MKKGFTLIELLVVVLIIGILAAIAMPQYTKAVEKSRTSEIAINTKALFEAENRYFLATGTYPSDPASELDISLPSNCATASTTSGTVISYDCGKFVYMFNTNSPHVTGRRVGSSYEGYRIASTEDGLLCYMFSGVNNFNKLKELCKSLGYKCKVSSGSTLTDC
ncbi:PilE-like protein [Elusimicrobium minutum Pei191]|uniref:PilE-like protein n=1 Tax=Elusimicrobium minutum (strain Pei191) TaxID=445932 RepID=B2KB19_ELUMP|nr:prepilin-type N-terminal cleavage/methylation domain-containing protein [Elusimicrobium minutum]ACC97778.1 PilE-like protein [Elusimicrobium minutum Pei191]